MRAPGVPRLRSRVREVVPEELIAMWRAARHPAAPWDEAGILLDERTKGRGRTVYPNYLYGLASAARTARAVGAEAFTAIEFGVAGGNGLVAMEDHARWLQERIGVEIEIHGFDAGSGLPPSDHPLDSPFAFGGGEFEMDEEALRARLDSSTLWIGEVRDRLAEFVERSTPPIGFVSHDFDYYTSTRDALTLFELPPERLLPRVTNYFDDLAGYPYSTCTGEWRAIEEFNAGNEQRRIGRVFGLKHQLPGAYRFAVWNESIFVLNVFDHPRYNAPEPQIARYDLGLR